MFPLWLCLVFISSFSLLILSFFYIFIHISAFLRPPVIFSSNHFIAPLLPLSLQGYMASLGNISLLM